MRYPDFLLIGAAKSGTTAAFYYISQHPEVYACPVREPNFFALMGETPQFAGPGDHEAVGQKAVISLESYCNLFEAAAPHQVAGEVSPLYLYDRQAPERIKQHIPEAKLIVLLRNPVDRAYASYLHLKRDQREPCETFEAALEEEESRMAARWEHLWHYVGMGNYAAQLSRYFTLFDRSLIKVFLYEDFQAQPAAVMAECFEFLGIDISFEVELSRRPNRSGIPRMQSVQNLTAGQGLAKRAAVKLIPNRLRGKIKTKIDAANLKQPVLAESTRKKLQDRFRPDNLRLETMIDRDLSGWLRD